MLPLFTMISISKILTGLILLFVFLGYTQAEVIVVAPTLSTAGSIQIASDITFTITSATPTNVYAFVFDEWVTSDGTRTGDPLTSGLEISLNGGATTLNTAFLDDNHAGTLGALTANDGYIQFATGVAVSLGDTVTLKAGTYFVPVISNFNPQGTQTFTGNMFVINSGATPISNIVAVVPEPSTCTLFAFGFGFILFSLRRRLSV